MRTVTPDAQSVFISGLPCQVPSRGRPDGQHLSHALGLRVRHSPQLNSRSLGHRNTRIYHSCLPPRPSLAVNHRMERIIPPWGHFICEMSGMTPIDPHIPVKATRPARGHHALRPQIACHVGSIDTDCSYLGLEKRRAEAIKGSVELRNRIDPRQMTTIRYGEARYDRKAHSGGEDAQPAGRLFALDLLGRRPHLQYASPFGARGIREPYSIVPFFVMSCVRRTEGA
jgi:hypothetical protein